MKIKATANTDNMGKLFVTLFAGSQPSTGTINQPGIRTRSSARNKVTESGLFSGFDDNFVPRPLRHCPLLVSTIWTISQSFI
jgi:hypothetical protein